MRARTIHPKPGRRNAATKTAAWDGAERAGETHDPASIESRRLSALRRYDILDTEPEAAYDDLTHLAAMVCRTPVALVAFVDADRIWFKSAIGLNRNETARDAGPASDFLGCLAHEPVVLEDTRNQAWTDGIGFFASAPLVSRDGLPLGSLCVMDPEPRALSEEQKEALTILARQVMAHLELRRNARDLADTVAELREAEKTIRYMAYHDALTGLPSRILFQARLAQAMKRAHRCDETMAVMFLDLDGFKSINDTWGHAAGDRLLVSVAARLTGVLRKSDTVARIGGDEFAIICPGINGAEDAGIVAGKLLATLENPLPVDGLGLHITASIGIALYPMDGSTPDSILVDADTAMYRAKRRGKNTFAFSATSNSKSCEHISG